MLWGASEYANSRPVGENIVSPAVITMYCGNCTNKCIEFGGEASIWNSTIAEMKNEIAAKMPPSVIRRSGVLMPIRFNAGYKNASNNGIITTTSNGFIICIWSGLSI